MRYFIFAFAIAFFISATATADEAAFRRQLFRHLTENSRSFHGKLKDPAAEVDVTLTIDRDGTLLDAAIDHGTGSPEDDENVLRGLRRMQPFPHIPDDMQAPYKIKAPLLFSKLGAAFGKQVYQYLAENSWVLPDGLKKKPFKAGVVFAIDRDGKLSTVAVDESSGSPDDDAAILTALRRLQSFPRVPDGLPAPYQFRTTFNFGPQPRLGYVDLKWPPMSVNTSGQEIAFRSDLRHRLLLFPRVLPEDVKIPRDVHSMIEFSIDRDGKLLDAKITKGFGVKTVDDGTLAWLKSTQPFPKLPAELKAPMKFTVEIVFGPQGYDTEARHTVSGVCRGC